MRALEPEIYNTLFRLVADRLPQPPPHRYGACRPRISDEVCFKGLFWRFVTSAAWTTIEAFLDYQVSDTTLRSRRDDWVAAGVFDDLMEHALSEYDRLIGLDLSHVAIDGSCQLAPGGTELTSAYAGSKGRQGFKWSCGVDAAGIGTLSVSVSSSTPAHAMTTDSCAPPWTPSPNDPSPHTSARCTSTGATATSLCPTGSTATRSRPSK